MSTPTAPTAPLLLDGKPLKPGDMVKIGKMGKPYIWKKKWKWEKYKKNNKWSKDGGRWESGGGGNISVIQGRGSYSLGTLLNTGARAIGGGYSGYVSGVPGGTIGAALGGGVNTILGMGSYDVRANSLWGNGDGQVPFMHKAGETIRLTHREYIRDLYSSDVPNTFKKETIEFNPGLESVLPWASKIANAFTEYQLLGCVVYFKSSSTDALASTNTALGSVLMAAQYNMNIDEFGDKQDMLNSMWAMEGKPSCDLALPIECDPSQNQFGIHNIRSDDNFSGDNQNEYDHCRITIATDGMQGAGINLGQLWIAYDMELRKPVMNSGQNVEVKADHYKVTGVTPWSNAAVFGDATLDEGNLGSSIQGNMIAFPVGCKGTYMLDVTWTSNLTSSLTPMDIACDNATVVNCFSQPQIGADPVSRMWYGAQGSARCFGLKFCFRITDDSLPASVTLDNGGLGLGNIYDVDICITKTPGEVFF